MRGFFLLLWISSGNSAYYLSPVHWSGLNQVPQGGASLAVFCDSKNKIGCLAVLLGAKHAQYAQIGLKIYNLIMELVLVLSSLSKSCV